MTGEAIFANGSHTFPLADFARTDPLSNIKALLIGNPDLKLGVCSAHLGNKSEEALKLFA
jgi:hypothetical protein